MNIIMLISIALCYILQTSDNHYFEDSRDGQRYEILKVNGLKWFGQNLNYPTKNARYFSTDSSVMADCGLFYDVHDAMKVCPEKWRLPTKKEVKKLEKFAKRNKTTIRQLLNIKLCGRIDGEKATKAGEQNTYWLNEPIENGNITHWHVFHDDIEIHNHNVINAKRKFPIRCVCEIKK